MALCGSCLLISPVNVTPFVLNCSEKLQKAQREAATSAWIIDLLSNATQWATPTACESARAAGSTGPCRRWSSHSFFSIYTPQTCGRNWESCHLHSSSEEDCAGVFMADSRPSTEGEQSSRLQHGQAKGHQNKL